MSNFTKKRAVLHERNITFHGIVLWLCFGVKIIQYCSKLWIKQERKEGSKVTKGDGITNCSPAYVPVDDALVEVLINVCDYTNYCIYFFQVLIQQKSMGLSFLCTKKID